MEVFIYNGVLSVHYRERSEGALSGEVDGKLYIATHAHMWCVYIFMCHTFITRECMDDFMNST